MMIFFNYLITTITDSCFSVPYASSLYPVDDDVSPTEAYPLRPGGAGRQGGRPLVPLEHADTTLVLRDRHRWLVRAVINCGSFCPSSTAPRRTRSSPLIRTLLIPPVIPSIHTASLASVAYVVALTFLAMIFLRPVYSDLNDSQVRVSSCRVHQ